MLIITVMVFRFTLCAILFIARYVALESRQNRKGSPVSLAQQLIITDHPYGPYLAELRKDTA